jgi:hypothetical protein
VTKKKSESDEDPIYSEERSEEDLDKQESMVEDLRMPKKPK